MSASESPLPTSRILSRSGSRRACSPAAGSRASVPWVKTGLLARRSAHARTHCSPPGAFFGVSPLRTAAHVLVCALTRPLRTRRRITGFSPRFANALQDGRTLPYSVPRSVYTSLRTVQTHLCVCAQSTAVFHGVYGRSLLSLTRLHFFSRISPVPTSTGEMCSSRWHR